ncbi:MAG: GAF domain-containing sensor histidine kinase [Armatimonadetes bacterium]|nr:GAF domain-containing sensor histidine kinase [Armatimonadota bacterium]
MTPLVSVFFVYGLAFFSMGLAIALEARRPSDLMLIRPLRYLAAFGMLHGCVGWIDMWLASPMMAEVIAPTVRIVRLALFAASVLALAQFGADLIASVAPRASAVRAVPLVLAVFWALNWTIVPHLAPAAVEEVTRSPSCLRCHAAVPPFGPEWVPRILAPASAQADVWLRYVLFLPASLLAAAGFWMEGRRLAGITYGTIARACRWTALAFVANAVMAGVVVPPAPLFPATVVNYDTFLSAVGIPPQLFRSAIAVIIAALTLRVLRVFEMDATRRLASATEARLDAQKEALETGEAARRAAETWTRTLEDRVASRTAELERRTHELAALNAVVSTVTSSLDLNTILEATVDHVLILVRGDGGGITVFPSTPGESGTSVLRGPSGADISRMKGFDPGATAVGDVAFAPGGAVRPFVRVPLRAKDRLLGELTVLGQVGGRYTEADVSLLSTVAQQVGVAVENATLFQETATRRREAETLYRLGTEITALSDLSQVLEHVVAGARELLAADVGVLSLMNEDNPRVVVRAVAGLRGEALEGVELAPGQGIAGYVIRSGQPMVVSDYLVDARISHELDGIVRQEGLHTHLAVPVVARGQAVGCLAVAYRRVRPVADDEIHLLTRMANQAAIAIENARLYQQVQSLAILEERDRLAREMHDSLGQSLGYLNLKSKLAEDLVLAGRTSEAQEELAQIRLTIYETYDEVRHAILGLRTAGVQQDLEATLRGQIGRLREQCGIPVDFEVRGSIPAVPALAAVQVTRIVQEALTNVRKHARAGAVRVDLAAEEGRLVVRVSDDGCGFDVGAVQRAAGARFGLETMRERAESIGGTLEITSAPGQGTTVALLVPLA